MIALALALALCLAAAAHDRHHGTIPNWMTLPPLLGAPLVAGLLSGGFVVIASIVGAAACSLAPLLLYRLRAMGGGDVKLFAALGALLGWTLGVEVQLLAYLLVIAAALMRALWQRDAAALVRRASVALRRSLRGPSACADTSSMRPVRLAPYVAVSAVIMLALELL